jgi:hypothetical protein
MSRRAWRVVFVLALATVAEGCGGGGTTTPTVSYAPPPQIPMIYAARWPGGTSNATIVKVAAQGNATPSMIATAASFSAIALAPDGSLFVVHNDSSGANRVADVYAPGSTTIARSFPIAGRGRGRMHVSIDSSGRLYVPSAGAVEVYDTASGAFVRSIATNSVPVAVVADDSGTMYIAVGTDVQVWPVNAAAPSTTYPFAPATVNGLAVAHDGTLYVVAGYATGITNGILLTGQLAVIPPAANGPAYTVTHAVPTDVAVDAAGTIYVSDTESISMLLPHVTTSAFTLAVPTDALTIQH